MTDSPDERPTPAQALSARIRAAHTQPPSNAQVLAHDVTADVGPRVDPPATMPSAPRTPMPPPQAIVIDASENETPAPASRFPPVSATRFVPITKPGPAPAVVASPAVATPPLQVQQPALPRIPALEPLATFSVAANLGNAAPTRPIETPPLPRVTASPAADLDASAVQPLAGTSFLQPMHFGLPASRVERPEPAPTRTRIPAILVVDDNADYRFVVVREMRRLRPHQIRIEEADGAQKALEVLQTLVRENEKVFILTDFRMPNLTGVDLRNAALRAHPNADLKILVYSGVNLRTAPELRDLGPDEFMEKPGDLIELRRQVSRLLERWIGPTQPLRAV